MPTFVVFKSPTVAELANAITFPDLVPIPRYDGQPWTNVRIEESTDSEGPWTIIDASMPLHPLDVDPKKPQTRVLTTTNATIRDGGWYRITFLDPALNEYRVELLHHVIDPPPSFIPTVQDIGNLMRARTKDDFDNEIGTFTSDTRPTDQQVIGLIRVMASRVTNRIGDDIPDNLYSDAKLAISVATAIAIEASFWPEQLGTNRSGYVAYKQIWDELMGTPSEPGSLISGINENVTGLAAELNFHPSDDTDRAFTMSMLL